MPRCSSHDDDDAGRPKGRLFMFMGMGRTKAKLRAIKPLLTAIDTRTVKPPPKVADSELLTPEHRAWREAVLRRAGYRCEAVDDGRRCERQAPARMFADHIIERSDGGAALDPENGQCLCGSHHTRKTAAARAARLVAR